MTLAVMPARRLCVPGEKLSNSGFDAGAWGRLLTMSQVDVLAFGRVQLRRLRGLPSPTVCV